MNLLIRFLLLMTIVVFIPSSFSDELGPFDEVCAYTDSETVSLMFKEDADSNNFLILGEAPEEGISSTIPDVRDSRCVELVLNNGVNCKLSNGAYDASRFYITMTGENFPSKASCEYESCSGKECAWFDTGESDLDEVDVGNDDDSSGVGTGITQGEETTYDDIEPESLGLNPFDEVGTNACEIPNSPFEGLYISKDICEARGPDCVYDPYRVGILTQVEGDSSDIATPFMPFKEDSMCVSKATRIRTCEDIRSQQLCQTYNSLNPNDNSLMGTYGCEWREVKSDIGTCMTSDLYYENEVDLASNENDKIINISSSLKRKNFIKNPLFEVTEGSGLYYWRGSYDLEENVEYNDLLGTKNLLLNQSDSINQLVSGIPFNLIFEIKIITDSNISELDVLIDSNRLETGVSKPLLSRGDFSSNLQIHSYTFTNDVDFANRNVSIRAEAQSTILGVSMNLKGSDDSATFEQLTSSIYPESMFEMNSFNCKLCSLGFDTGNCKKEMVDSISNCELISNSPNEKYDSNYQSDINPYVTYTGLENRFVEEDMAFCGLYTNQSACENPNSKLNSIISQYHSTTDSLCKWRVDTSLPNNGMCYKDSRGLDHPDTFLNGQLSHVGNYGVPDSFFVDYNQGADEQNFAFSDFQLSCDVLPPHVVIEPYKKIIVDGEAQTQRVTQSSIDEEGVIDFYYVRIENYVSPGCSVFNDFTSDVILVLEGGGLENKLWSSAEDFFPEYNNSKSFFQRTYSDVEFEELLEDRSVPAAENFIQSGTIRVFDSSGNMQKGSQNLNSGETLGRININLSLDPTSEAEVYSFTNLLVESSDVGNIAEYMESCDIDVIDGDLKQRIFKDTNVSISNLTGDGFEVGGRISMYESNRAGNEDDEREEFNISIQAICRDKFDRESIKLENYDYINTDGLIVHTFSNGFYNSQGLPYLDVATKSMFLNISAKADVSCSASLWQGDNEISNLGGISFPDASSIPDFSRGYSGDIDFSSYIEEQGIYDYILTCNFQEGEFERIKSFEYNSQVPQIDSVKLVAQDTNKWAELGGMIYLDVQGENLLTGDNQITTNTLKNYIQTQTRLNFEDASEFETVTICGAQTQQMPENSNNYTIQGSIINELEPYEDCGVEIDTNNKQIILTSLVEVSNVIGATTIKEINTILDYSAPNINVTTQSGGYVQGGTLYFNSNNPTFEVDLGMPQNRAFNCSIDLNVDGTIQYTYSSDSSNGKVIFDILDFDESLDDVLSSFNTDLFMNLQCQESLFEKEVTTSFSLEKDLVAPKIEGLTFTDLGKNWGVPSSGNSYLATSDIEVNLLENENWITCQVGVNYDEDKGEILEATKILSIQGENSNKIVGDNKSIIKKQNSGIASLLTLNPSHTGSTNNLIFNVGVECVDGAGNKNKTIFNGYELNLWDNGDVEFSGRASENNDLELKVESLFSLQGQNINIWHGEDEEEFYTGTIGDLSPEFTQKGLTKVLSISDAGSLREFATSENYPFKVEIYGGGSSFEGTFDVLIDNETPEIELTDNANDEGVIFGSTLRGQLIIRDSPEDSRGFLEEEVTLYSQETPINSSDSGQTSQTTLERDINYNDLEPGMYRLNVRAIDGSGNEVNENFIYNLSDAFEINLLGSSNVEVSDTFSMTWFSQVDEPILKFESTTNVENCYLSPGVDGGYVGSTYDFDSTGEENTFEIDTSNLNGFSSKNGKNEVIIGCERPDRDNEVYEIAVFLHIIEGVPDYVLNIDWGRNQFIPLGEDEKLIEFEIIQKGKFKEVTCELNNGANSIPLQNVVNDEIGKLEGNTSLSEGTYTLDLMCETPFGVQGPLKSYTLNVAQEEFSIGLQSMQGGVTNRDINVNTDPIMIPSSLIGEGSSDFTIEFTTNYQDPELECSVDTDESGIIEFITSFFVNSEVSADYSLTQLGLFEAEVEISQDTTSIDISCSKGAEFNSPTFEFDVSVVDESLIDIGGITISGER